MARERFSGLGRTSLLMFGIISATKALGFVREVLLTRAFGASEETDAFYLVFGVVVIAASLLMSETPRVLVPRILTRMSKEDERDARSLVGGSTFVLCAAATVAGLALYALAEPFIVLLAPEYGPEQVQLAAKMVRLFAATGPIAAIVGTVSGLARAKGHFFLAQIAFAGMNVGTVAGILVWSDSRGIIGAALGLVLGMAGSGTVMLLYLLLQKALPRPTSGAALDGFHVLGLVLPLILVSSKGGYLAVLVNNYFAALLEPGHFSCLGYSYRLLVVPVQVFYGAMAVALLPALADRVAAGDHQEIERMIGRAFRMLLLLMGPMVLGMAAFGEPVVRLAFGRGSFGQNWVELTALLLLCQAPMMLSEILRQPLATLYFAYGKARMPVLFGLIRTALLLAIFPLVWRDYGAVGIALGMVVADAIVVVVMLGLARRMFGLRLPGMAAFSAKLAGVTAIVLAVGLGLWSELEAIGLTRSGFFMDALLLGSVAALSALGILGGTRLLGIKEGGELVRLVRGVLLRGRSSS